MSRSTGIRPLCVQLLPDTVGAGAENQARYLIDGMRKQGEFDIELAYFAAGVMHQSFEALDVPLRHVPRGRRFGLLSRARRLRITYAQRQPDIIQTWLYEGNIIGLLAARRWPQTAVVISQRNSWRGIEDYRTHALVQRLLMGRADAAISNSSGGADALAHLGFPREHIAIVPNGIPSERVEVCEARDQLRRRHGWTSRKLVGWVGRASTAVSLEQKGLGNMLDAMSILRTEHSSASLLVIGATRDEISNAGYTIPTWVEPIGWVERPVDYLNACDVVVISSRWEGSSNAAAEALMLGLPVVTTDCGDHCSAVAHAGGKIVRAGDGAAIARGISEVFGQPMPARSEVRGLVGDAFSVDAMIESTLAVYRRVLRRQAGRTRA